MTDESAQGIGTQAPAMDPPPPDPPAMNLKDTCDALRTGLLAFEKEVRGLKERPDFKGADAFPGQHGEMIAQSMLAVRHLEDARMRLGKILQYARDGVSVFDKP